MLTKDPLGILVLSVGVSLTGAFALALHTGVSMRESNAIHYESSFRGTAGTASTFFSDLERGGKVLKTRAAEFFSSAFSAEAPAQQTAAAAPSGLNWSEGEEPDAEDPEETAPSGDSYVRNYEEQFGGSFVPPPGGDGGGESFSGGGESASEQPVVRRAKRSAGPGQEAGAALAPDEPKALPKGQDVRARGNDAGLGKLRHSYASLSNDPSRSPDVQAAGGGAAARFSGSGSGSSGRASWAQSGGGGNMDGAMNGLRSGAQSSYNSQMKAGAPAAAAAASAAGAAAPAASKAKETSATGGSEEASEKESEKTEPGSETEKVQKDYTFRAKVPAPAAEETDLLKSIVSEKLNGASLKYISDEEVAGDPDPSLLKSGSVAGGGDNKSVETPDPAKYSELTPARKQELKKAIHVFLKKVENKPAYGAMTDLYSTSCSLTREICAEHGLTENYLTMTTARRAKLVLGVKYVSERWRLYTLEFTPPPGFRDAPRGLTAAAALQAQSLAGEAAGPLSPRRPDTAVSLAEIRPELKGGREIGAAAVLCLWNAPGFYAPVPRGPAPLDALLLCR
ncbi:MAG TPA: hypothetical protein PKI19_04505 [Elusimicrobiales bacterium]|nr:hypothetical protein [Elusimicrobiales bacterium]